MEVRSSSRREPVERVFTIDAAERADERSVVELGDGQVAGRPGRTDLAAFYGALNEASPAP